MHRKTFSSRAPRLAAGGLAAAALTVAVLIPAPVQGQTQPCSGILFSTEEDFYSLVGERADGNPIVSDGDLLSVEPSGGGAAICARNRDLLQAFDVRADLGLDAVDAVEPEERLFAFSTELDHPRGDFTAGDLLFTTGGVIPNAALLAAFQLRIPRDMGLDAVHLVGDRERIRRLVAILGDLPRDVWIENPGQLVKYLEETGTDIWFSTEGTELPLEKPRFLDGDLLSAKTGTIVAPNSILLPPPVPAGIPDRGVDFGLDAATGSREENREEIHYSTEILYEGEDPSFTDGDVLRFGNGVVIPHAQLVAPFEPRADFLGLDALHFFLEPRGCENKITNIGGLKLNELQFDAAGVASLTGMSAVDPPGQVTLHPHGRNVGFWGTVCDDVKRFRVVYRKVSAGPPSGPNDGTGMPVTAAENWQVYQPVGSSCVQAPWSSDNDGWYDAVQWNALQVCDDVFLTNWFTHKLGGGPGSADANDLYRVWLVFETTSGVIDREAKDHFVRLDNIAPKIPQLRFAAPADPACPEFTAADMPVTLEGEIVDEHFWGMSVRLGGDSLPPFSYPRQNHYNPVDPGEFGNLDDTGTTPDGSVVALREVDVNDLGALPDQSCCYGATVYAQDRAIDGSFHPIFNLVGGGFRSATSREAYFGYTPP